MSDLNNDNFDDLMCEHFASELDGQLKRTAPVIYRQPRWPFVAIAGAALAAAIAWFVMRPLPVPTQPSVATVDPSSVKYEMAWQTVDHGTVFLDEDTPMQAYVRQQIETTQWIDPDTKALVKMSVPHEQIVLIGLNTY